MKAPCALHKIKIRNNELLNTETYLVVPPMGTLPPEKIFILPYMVISSLGGYLEHATTSVITIEACLQNALYPFCVLQDQSCFVPHNSCDHMTLHPAVST